MKKSSKVVEVIAPAIQSINVQKVMSLLRTKGIRYDGFLTTSDALDLLKKEGSVILSDGSFTIVSVNNSGKFSYFMQEGVIDTSIPSGDHAGNRSGSVKAYKTKAGTEMIVLQQMETMLQHGVSNGQDWEEDDDDDDDDDEDEDFHDRHRVIRKASKSVVITPAIYFQFVKSKLTENAQSDLSAKLNKLKGMMLSADMLKQQALYEELALQFAGIVRELEVSSINCGKRIPEATVKHFINHIKERPVKFDKFENFPRVVPADIAVRIKEVQDANVFDSLHIVYVDYVNEELKTTKQKIREKDPVLFGKLAFQPDTLYYICDWIDEYCDITLEKIIEVIKVDDPTFKLDEVPEVDDEFIKRTMEEIGRRHLALKKTNPRNYRRLMEEQEEAAEERREQAEMEAARVRYALEHPEEAQAEVEATPIVEVPVEKSFFKKFMDAAGNMLAFKKAEPAFKKEVEKEQATE